MSWVASCVIIMDLRNWKFFETDTTNRIIFLEFFFLFLNINAE